MRLFYGFKIGKTDNFSFILNPNDKYISETLLHGTIWESYVKILLYLLVNENDTVVDVGANIGVHTLNLSRLVGNQGVVHSFEPVPLLFTQLAYHCLLNNCMNVKLYQVGLNDTETVSFVPRISEDDMKEKINWGNTKLDNDNISGVKIQTKTLDQLNLNPQLIKIDVECMELNVLKGMKQTIDRSRPFIIIEIQPDGKEEVKKFIQEIDCCIYSIWITAKVYKYDYVLVPIEKHDFFKQKITNLNYPCLKLDFLPVKEK